MRKRIIYSAVASVVAMMFSFCVGSNVLAKPIELKAVCFLPTNHELAVMTAEWVKRINAELKDQLIVNYAGGPEVIPPLQQGDAVKTGVVDIVFYVNAYLLSSFPEGWSFFTSKYSPAEERKPGGFYDFMVNRYQKIDLMYIGRWLYSPFYLWSNKPVNRLQDLKGMKMRTAAHFDRFMKEMGIIPVTVMPTDVYSSLERGAVEGFGWPLLGARQLGWTDKCKYVIDHPFHAPCDAAILINLATWNKIPKESQNKIIKITANLELDTVEYFKKEYEKEWKELEKVGVKRIQFSPSEAKEYIDIIYRIDWEILSEKVPALVPELKRITGH